MMADTVTPEEPIAIDNNQNGGLSRKQWLSWTAVAAGLCILLFLYFLYTKYFPATDDAYVQAHVIDIAAQVTGPISKVYVHNNQFVKAGQALFDIDPAPFETIVLQKTAQLNLAQQQMLADVAAVEVAKAQVEKAQAQLVVDQKNYQRIITLVKNGQASVASGDDAYGKYQASQAALNAAQNQLTQAQENLGESGDRNAQIRQAQAELETAKLNLSYTHITASKDGYVTNFELHLGSMINADQPLFQFVENHLWYVYANYKETQMAKIRQNQCATVSVDMYPGHHFTGYVDSISRGSGAAFSLLPPENATGNWVKVTQRFPIKVIITDVTEQYPLRVGASSSVRINTLKNCHQE